MMVPHESGRDSRPRDQERKGKATSPSLLGEKSKRPAASSVEPWTGGLADWWPHNWDSFSLLAAARKTAKTVAWKWWSAQVDEIPPRATCEPEASWGIVNCELLITG